MSLNWYVPAVVTKAIIAIIGLHFILGVLSPPSLAALLDRYLEVIALFNEFLAEVIKQFIRKLFGL